MRNEELTVGRPHLQTVEKVTVQNLVDVINAAAGTIDESEIRTAEVDAVVDTGATHLCLPPSVIAQLGLRYSRTRRVTTANGTVERRMFKGADVTILGRNEEFPVMENDETTPPLIGYVVLEVLDFVVDPKSQRLIPNPEHGGKWVSDLY